MKLGILTSHRYCRAYRLTATALVAMACGLTGTLANAQSSDLLTAAQRGDLPAVNALLRSGIDVNRRTASDHTTALMLASQYDHLEVVQALLAAKADPSPELARPLGGTPLTVALSQRHWDVARVLVEAGANVNATTGSGVTPLMLAARENSPSSLAMVQALLAAHADVNGTFHGGDTALGVASSTGSVEVVQALLAANSWVDVNIKQHDGKTPLINASANGRADVVRLLLAAKADVSAEDNDGKRALMLALQYEHPEVAKLLTSASGAVPVRK
jgi:ankyrin repeat protein